MNRTLGGHSSSCVNSRAFRWPGVMAQAIRRDVSEEDEAPEWKTERGR